MPDVIVQCSANNEFRIGWQSLPPRRRGGGDLSCQREASKEAAIAALPLNEVITEGGTNVLIDYTQLRHYSTLSHTEAEQYRESQQRALDITADFQRAHKRTKKEYRHGWGYPTRTTEFGRYARHTILEAGSIASRGIGGDGKGVEVTLTLPGSGSDIYRTLSEWSGYAVNRLLQYIRRHARGCDWFYVWEWQQRGALHLHMALSGMPQVQLLSLGYKIRRAWYKVLGDISTRSGVDLWFNRYRNRRNTTEDANKANRVAEIRKNLAAYFSKYVSKQALTKPGKVGTAFYPPSRWWGISRALLRKVKEERLNVRFENLSEDESAELLSLADSYFRSHDITARYEYSFEVSHAAGGVPRRVGSGWRTVYYFSSEVCASLKNGLHDILALMKSLAERPVVRGYIGAALHPCNSHELFASMQ